MLCVMAVCYDGVLCDDGVLCVMAVCYVCDDGV